MKNNKCCVNCLFCYQQVCVDESIFGKSVRWAGEMDTSQREVALKKDFETVFKSESNSWIELCCIEKKWEYPIGINDINEDIKNMLTKKANCQSFYLYNKKGHKTLEACREDRDTSKEQIKHIQTLIISIVTALITGALTMYAAIYSVNKGNSVIHTNKQSVEQIQNKQINQK